MGFLGRLFGSNTKRAEKGPVDPAWHFFVKSKFADEIIDVRVDPSHDLAEEFEGDGDSVSHYSANKDVIGAKSFRMIHVHLVFDRERRYTGEAVLEGGELVDRTAYDAWKGAQPQA